MRLPTVLPTRHPSPHLMDVICLTTSAGECRSMRRLWMRISKRSQVLVPSPHGDLRVVMRSVLVGRRTGPLTLSCLSLAPRTRSADTARGRGQRPGGSAGLVWVLCMQCSSSSGDRSYIITPSGAPFSRLLTLREVRVMRMRCTCGSSSSRPGLPAAAGLATAAICVRRRA